MAAKLPHLALVLMPVVWEKSNSYPGYLGFNPQPQSFLKHMRNSLIVI